MSQFKSVFFMCLLSAGYLGTAFAGQFDWTSLSFNGTSLDGMDLDSIEIVLGAGLNYLAIDDFKFAEFDGNVTSVSINNVSMTEGDAGPKTFTFTISRNDNTSDFSVDVGSFDGSATIADMDYNAIIPNPTTINFLMGGSLTQTVDMIVNGDTKSEIPETFTLSLSNATNGVQIAGGTGIGTILDDDTACETFESAMMRGETTFMESGLMFTSTDQLIVSDYHSGSGGSGPSDWFLESDSTMIPHSGIVGEIQINSPGSLFKMLRLDLWLSNDGDENSQEPDMVRFTGKIFGGGTASVDIMTTGSNWNQNISFAGTALDNLSLTALEVELIGTSDYVAIDNFCYEPASALTTCPTLGAVSSSSMQACVDSTFNITATGLLDMDMMANGEQDFGIEFVAFTSTTMDPYTGGISLGTVSFGSLTSSNTVAELTGASFASSGTYEVYAILSPAPGASFCRPSVSTSIAVNANPMVTFTAPADLCADAGVQIDLSGGSPTGGSYSGMGVSNDVNGITYDFDPAMAGVGTHTISYDYTDTNGCSGSAMDDVQVFAALTISCPPDPQVIEWPVGFNLNPVPPNTPQDPSIDPGSYGVATSTGGSMASITYQDVLIGPSPANCPNLWIVQRTWIVSDPICGMMTCVQTFTFSDTTPPTIICPPPLTFEWPPGFNLNPVPPDVPQDPSIDPAITGNPITNDNCGVASVTFQDILIGPIPGICPFLWRVYLKTLALIRPLQATLLQMTIVELQVLLSKMY